MSVSGKRDCTHVDCPPHVQVMRHDVALALGKSGPNVDAMCTDKEFGGRFLSFQKVRHARMFPNPTSCSCTLARSTHHAALPLSH